MATKDQGLIQSLRDRMRRGPDQGSRPGDPATEWDPLHLMREILRWDPFREMVPFHGRGTGRDSWVPGFEVRETADSFRFIADLPGVKREDLDITLSGNRLQIAGKREAESEDKDDQIYAYERSFGSFSRSFTLPDNVDLDHVTSELREGILTIVVPKTAAAKPRRIEIGEGGAKS